MRRRELVRDMALGAAAAAPVGPVASLPFVGPMRIHVALNKGRAKSLGLRLPAALLARADEVIE